MIEFDEGRPTLCGRVIWGYEVGYITEISQTTYRVRWLDGNETTMLRPDLDDESEWLEAAE